MCNCVLLYFTIFTVIYCSLLYLNVTDSWPVFLIILQKIWLCWIWLTPYEYFWPLLSVSDYFWPYVICLFMSDYVLYFSICINIYNNIWLGLNVLYTGWLYFWHCFTVFECVWLHLSVSDYVQLCLTVWMFLTLLNWDHLCLTVFTVLYCVSLCLIYSELHWLCLILPNYIWLCLAVP